jgi:Alpha/beta hydrolase
MGGCLEVDPERLRAIAGSVDEAVGKFQRGYASRSVRLAPVDGRDGGWATGVAARSATTRWDALVRRLDSAGAYFGGVLSTAAAEFEAEDREAAPGHRGDYGAGSQGGRRLSELTLHQLLSCDPAPYVEAAAAWEEWAEEVDTMAEVYIRGVRDLGDAWPDGDAAEAARWRAAALRDELSNAYQPAQQIGWALRQLADGMVQIRDYTETILAGARACGLEVDEAGAVTAPLDMYRSGSPEEAARLVDGYANDLNSVLERARGLDDQIAQWIAAMMPDPVLGFGTAASRPISRSEVELQRRLPPWVVQAWWHTLTPMQQEQVIHDFPELVGWLDGVPADDRNTANRLHLDNDLSALNQRAEDLRQRVADLQDGPSGGLSGNNAYRMLHDELASVEADIARLDKVKSTLNGLGAKGFLLGYDAAGDGKLILAVGNPDTAAHTAVWVPGTNTELEDIHSNTERVKNLQQDADTLTQEAVGDVATIMWLGYDAPEFPDNTSVVTYGRSEEGGAALDSFVDGLRLTHEGGEYSVTAIGHSYGTAVVAEAALRGDGLAVNDIVVAGSPGMHTDNAANLNIEPRHVWAGSAPGDPFSDPNEYPAVVAGEAVGGVGGGVVTGLTLAFDHGHGISPHQPEFGANQFHVDTSGHSDYWKQGSESLLNQAYIVVGKYDKVTLDHGSPPP